MTSLLLSAWLCGGPAHAEPAELELAYQREFAYLQEERRTLDGRLADLRSEERDRVAGAEAALASLQARLLTLRTQREQLEEQLSAAARDADGLVETGELVESTLFQAQSSLGTSLPEATTTAEQAQALEQAYTEGVAQLQAAGRVEARPGQWFRADGTSVDGTLYAVGNVAAFGVGDASGALVPVGEGRLKLRDDDSAATAHALAEGRLAEELDLFLFEDRKKRVEEAPEKSLWTTLKAGGVVGGVILALGLVAALLAVLRTLSLGLAGRGGAAVAAAVTHLDQGRWATADRLVQTTAGAAPRVMAALLPLGPGSRQRLEDRASEALLLEQPSLDRFGSAILVIAAVAPLLGLLGTVTGMIGTFEIITEFGTGDPRMLSGGISEALVTTQLGLVVAIPTLLVGNLLDRRAEHVLSRLELAALAVINRSEGPPASTEAPDHRVDDAPVALGAHEQAAALGALDG